MADLSVTDVQNLLREHAEHGHDVTQHPHMVFIGETNKPSVPHKPFGVVVNSHLMIHHSSEPGRDVSGLSTYLIHGEKHMGSVINSHIGRPIDPETYELLVPKTHKPTLLYRNAALMTPTVTNGKSFYTSTVHNSIFKKRLDYYYENQFGRNKTERHPSIQESLTHMQEQPAEYFDKHGLPVGNKNIIGFNPIEGLHNYAKYYGDNKPFSGLITIAHSRGDIPNEKPSYYIYNPNTEQLLRRND